MRCLNAIKAQIAYCEFNNACVPPPINTLLAFAFRLGDPMRVLFDQMLSEHSDSVQHIEQK